MPKRYTKPPKGDTYQSRQESLERLGFKTYSEYLRSTLWRKVRIKVYKEKGSLCYLCGDLATELHHNRYHVNDLCGRKLKYINPICHECHGQVEFNEIGNKVTLEEAKHRFWHLRSKFKG